MRNARVPEVGRRIEERATGEGRDLPTPISCNPATTSRADVGALAMGATTYQWVLDHLEADGEAWPYPQPTWVFTHRTFPPPPGDVRFTQADVRDVHAAMVEAASGRGVWLVGGGDLVGQFADAGLLDEVWVQFAPVTLGAGKPLLPRRLDLALLEVDRNRDFCVTRYAVTR